MLFYSSHLFSQSNLSDFQFKKVGAIKIQADGPVDTEFLLTLIEITPNVDIVTTSKIRRSIELLYETGNFTNILVDANLVDDRVQLTFLLRKVYRIEFVHLTGQLGVSGGKIHKKLQLRKLEPYTPEKILNGRDNILSVLHENGYYNARVMQDVLLNRQTKQAQITYQIRAGAPAYVHALVFSGSPYFPQPQLLSVVKIRPGTQFKESEFSRDQERIEALYDRNGFLEHRIEVVKKELETGDRMHLEVAIDAGKQLVLQTTGYPLSDKAIRQQVPILSEHSYNDDTLEEGRRNLFQYFQARGYYEAKVSWKKEFLAEKILITYSIEPGLLYKIDKVNIRGNANFARANLLKLMQTKESGTIGAEHLITKVFETDLDRIIAAYRQRGFLFAHFTRRDVIPQSDGKLNVEMEIDEGAKVIVSDLRFHGNIAISTESLMPNLEQKIGEPISEAKVKTDSNYIVALYSDAGYPRIQLETRLLLSRDKTKATIEYRIIEGNPVSVDRIVISGNYRTKRHVIEESLFFQEDDPFSLRKIIASQSKLYSLNIFDRVDMDVPRPDSLQQQQNVLIRLTETRPYTISYGFGYQTFDKLRGIFSISNRNLYGTARIIALQTRGGFKEGRAVLSYTDPRLFFHKVTSTFSGLAEHGVRTSYSFTRYGLSFRVEKKLSKEPLYLEVGEKPEPSKSLFLGFDFEDITTTGTPPSDAVNRQFHAIHLSSVSASFVRDARDNPIDPIQGNYFSTDLQYATSLLGSETDFLKSFDQFQYYVPVRHSVIATALRLGLAKGFKGLEQLPISQSFFAGGGRTIRGFKLDTAGPLDPITGDPLGGNMLLIWNLEYRFPIFGSLGGVVFFDYGNVFKLVSDFSFSELRETSGFGFRYKTPIGPLTIDWGYKLDRKTGESPSEFFLSVGHAF